MTREQIVQALKERHAAFAGEIASLSDNDYLFAPAGKWNAGQQMEHIYLSVSPLGLLAFLPRFVVKRKFGTANRPSRSYDEVVARYRRKLEEGGTATGAFVPAPVNAADRARLEKKMLKAVKRLSGAIARYPEEQLDLCILPHPLLGKLTLREMMYFTLHHVDHHRQAMLRNLSAADSV